MLPAIFFMLWKTSYILLEYILTVTQQTLTFIQLTDRFGLSSIGGTDVVRKHIRNKPGKKQDAICKIQLHVLKKMQNTCFHINILPERKPTQAQCDCQPIERPDLLWLDSQVPGLWSVYQMCVQLSLLCLGPCQRQKHSERKRDEYNQPLEMKNIQRYITYTH